MSKIQSWWLSRTENERSWVGVAIVIAALIVGVAILNASVKP